MEKMKKIALTKDGYELTTESGDQHLVGIITSNGVKRKLDGHFDHDVLFSNGDVQRHVVSTETLVIPDYPALYK